MEWRPKKVVAQYQNKDGIPCIAMLLTLSGGACITHQSDFEVKLIDNGHTLVVLESWTHHYADMKDYYARHPREHDISDEDWVRRQLAMTDEVERMKKESVNGLVSIYKYRLPWKAAEIVERITGTTDGARTCHIDIYSKKRITAKNIFVNDGKRGKKALFTDGPIHSYSVLDG